MKETEKRKKMGRPPLKPEDRRLPSMAFRPTHDLRKMLEDAAAKSGRSLSQEIEYRLWRSAIDDEARLAELHHEFKGAHNYALAKVIARMAGELGDAAWTRWSRDPYIFTEFRKALDTFLDALTPPQPPERKPGDTETMLRSLLDPEHRAEPGKALAEEWLRQISAAKISNNRDTVDLRIAHEVADELAPLINREK